MRRFEGWRVNWPIRFTDPPIFPSGYKKGWPLSSAHFFLSASKDQSSKALSPVSATVSHGLPPSIHLLSSSLSNTPSFICFFSLQVGSSWLLFPITLWLPPFLPGPHSLLSKRSWRVLTSFFNGCYTSYGQPCHSLPSLFLLCFLSTLLYFSFVTHSCFSFPIQVSSLSSQLSLRLSLWFMLPCGF